MFETAVVHSHAADRQFSWLSLSLAVHSAAVAAVLAASLATVRLPDQAPKQMIPFIAAIRRAGVAPLQLTAPTIIPNTITPVADQPSDGPPTTIGSPIVSDIGVGNDAPSSAIAPDAAGPLPIGNGVKSPIVIRRVEPIYPPLAVRARMSGSAVLQCIIDKSGRIRDVRVVTSTFSAFEQPAIDAVQQWLFAPGTLNGQAVDTIFELTVRFQVK
jgi:protein TonB